MSLTDSLPHRRAARESLARYLTQWIDSRAWLRPSTCACYRLHIDRHLIPALGGLPLRDLAPAHVERLAYDLLASGLSTATVERVLATLSSACSTAVATGLIRSNPVKGVRVRRGKRKPHPRWNTGHARAFLDGLGLDPLDLLFRTALMTGMRRGELLGLRWTDVDLVEGAIHVQRSRLQVGSRIYEDDLKTHSSARTVYLDPATVRMLKRLRMRSGQSQYVFTDVQGRPLTPGWVSARFARRIELMQLPTIRFHDLRHASATLGLASGESLKEVSQRLGHADIAVTANIYTEVLPETAKASASRLATALSWPEGALLVRSA